MSRGARHTAVGVGLTLALALSVLPVQAAPAPREARAERAVRERSTPQAPSLFARFRSLIASATGDPRQAQPTQGPTVDPNGIH